MIPLFVCGVVTKKQSGQVARAANQICGVVPGLNPMLVEGGSFGVGGAGFFLVNKILFGPPKLGTGESPSGLLGFLFQLRLRWGGQFGRCHSPSPTNTANLTEWTIPQMGWHGKWHPAVCREVRPKSSLPFHSSSLSSLGLAAGKRPPSKLRWGTSSPTTTPPFKHTINRPAIPSHPFFLCMPYTVRPRRLPSGFFHNCGASNQRVPCGVKWRR
jgi:hypothetical protein